MIDIQRRHAEVFRIRLGDRDGARPRKLADEIRITAPAQPVVQAFVDVYGGAVTSWEDQWQAYLPTSELRILVLPGQSIQQWWEFYRGSVCERRCDGYLEQKSGKRCMCPEDIDERVKAKGACSPMTRVNVLCPDVAVVGAGGLVTHSLIAAETLPQSIAVAESALKRGLMVPAVLRVVEHKGRNHFIVPQIEITGVSLLDLSADTPELPHATRTPLAQLEGGQVRRLTPVPAIEGPRPTIAEQSAPPAAAPPRKNAAPEIPASGRRRAAPAKAPGEDGYWQARAFVEAAERGLAPDAVREIAAGVMGVASDGFSMSILSEAEWEVVHRLIPTFSSAPAAAPADEAEYVEVPEPTEPPPDALRASQAGTTPAPMATDAFVAFLTEHRISNEYAKAVAADMYPGATRLSGAQRAELAAALIAE
jgi:hypothetical protein